MVLDLAALPETFWNHVQKTAACWLWTSNRNRNGYGIHRSQLNKVRFRMAAHRMMWQAIHGRPIPDGMFVCHTCDNPPCVRPDHLFLGNRSDNMRDCSRKGRNAMQRHPELSHFNRAENFRGERHSNAKLTTAQVIEMRATYDGVESISSVARRYGITSGAASQIIRRITWRHLD